MPTPTATRTGTQIPHLLGLYGMRAARIREFLATAREFAAGRRDDRPLAGRTVANLFFEDSTRTRNSFSAAAYRLGAQVIDLAGSSSSVNKGETLIDTARNVESMGIAALCVRAKQSGAAAMIARGAACPVVNAGDGKHEHPTQGLLDAYALAEAKGRLDSLDLSGLKVAIVGDLASSRVARSSVAALTTLGAKVVAVGPPGLVPAGLGAEVVTGLDRILPEMDAVMMLRIQFERHADGAPPPAAGQAAKSGAIASVREFREFYALTEQREARMKPGAVVMHPGPINRGIELDAAVADGPRSIILNQVGAGVFVRMAVFTMLTESEAR
ncbi:MAG: aspartate carbamoyltransferase catalytic subunit [Phycisphaerales bacterium]